MKYTRHNKRGFTVFFAILVGSLALAIGLSIYELLVRELELSQVARESQYAIYAADAGAECAMYWDYRCTSTAGCVCTAWDSGGACILGTAFATTSNFSTAPNPASGIRCSAIGSTEHDIAASGWPGGTDIYSPPDLTGVTLPPGAPWVPWYESTNSALPIANATTTFIILLSGSTAAPSVRNPCAKVSIGKLPRVAGEPPRTTIISRGYNTCAAGGQVRVERAFQVSY